MPGLLPPFSRKINNGKIDLLLLSLSLSHRISWSDQFHLFIAMGDVVKICLVKQRNAQEAAQRNLPDYMVEITSTFR